MANNDRGSRLVQSGNADGDRPAGGFESILQQTSGLVVAREVGEAQGGREDRPSAFSMIASARSWSGSASE